MTRNMQVLLGDFIVDGVFVGAMTVVIEALIRNQELLSHYLYVIFRDELQSSAGAETATLEAHLQHSVNLILRRIGAAGETQGSAPITAAQRAVLKQNVSEIASAKARDLMKVAKSPKYQSQMEPSWHPWF